MTILLGAYNIINTNYKNKNCMPSYHCNILEDGLNLNYKIVDAIDLCSLFIMPIGAIGAIIGIIFSIREIKLLEK